jgi:hypothetical protein
MAALLAGSADLVVGQFAGKDSSLRDERLSR